MSEKSKKLKKRELRALVDKLEHDVEAHSYAGKAMQALHDKLVNDLRVAEGLVAWGNKRYDGSTDVIARLQGDINEFQDDARQDQARIRDLEEAAEVADHLHQKECECKDARTEKLRQEVSRLEREMLVVSIDAQKEIDLLKEWLGTERQENGKLRVSGLIMRQADSQLKQDLAAANVRVSKLEAACLEKDRIITVYEKERQ